MFLHQKVWVSASEEPPCLQNIRTGQTPSPWLWTSFVDSPNQNKSNKKTIGYVYVQIVHIMCLMPRLHMQVWQPGTERKACKKVFLVVRLAQYFICKVDRKLASYYKQEFSGLKLRKLFSQASVFVPGRQNR